MLTSLFVHDAERLYHSLGSLPAPMSSPVLIVVSGLPGTGKSFFSRRLAEKLPAAVLESDALRKALFRRPTYSPPESFRLFQAIHSLIERLLKERISVILDATNLSERHRQELHDIADRLGVKLILVRVEAPPSLVLERLAARTAGPGNGSEAGWEVYQKMKTTVEKIRRRHFIVDTSRDITPVIDKIVRIAIGKKEN